MRIILPLNATPKSLSSFTATELAISRPLHGCRPLPRLPLFQICAPLQPSRSFHGNVPRRGLYDTIFGDPKPPTKISALARLLQTHQEDLDQLKKIDPIIHRLLAEGHPDRVLHALLAPLSEDFYHNASQPFFGAVFSLIDSNYFVQPFKDLYRYVKPSLLTGPNEIRIIRRLERQLGSFTRNLARIVQRRKNAGHRLDVCVYRHLLACAAALADTSMADIVWEELLSQADVKPDQACYAYLMETKCWKDSWHKKKQFKFRVTPGPKDNHPHQDVIEAGQSSAKSLRQDIIGIFQQMVHESKIDGDEHVFCSLITAMGREGDMEGVSSILKSVWHIDVGLMREVDEEELETPLHYEADSPLRPTNRLLFTIAHIFGANNDIDTAIRLVDYLSRQYDLRIQREVWQQLLEWAYVLSKRSTTPNRRDLGAISTELFERVWLMMTCNTHSVQPDIVLQSYRSLSMKEAWDYAGSLRSLSEARDILQRDYDSLESSIDQLFQTCQFLQVPGGSQVDMSNASNRIEGSIRSPNVAKMLDNAGIQENPSSKGAVHLDEQSQYGTTLKTEPVSPVDVEQASNIRDALNPILPAAFFNIHRLFLLRSLRFERDLQLLMVGIRRLVSKSTIPRLFRAEFERRFLPTIVWQYQAFLPDEIQYRPVASVNERGQSTGVVSLQMKDARMTALLSNWNSRHWGEDLRNELFTTTNARIRNLCQVNSHEKLVGVCHTLNLKWLRKTAYTGPDWTGERNLARQDLFDEWENEPPLAQKLRQLTKSERDQIARQSLGARRKQRGIDRGWIDPDRTPLEWVPQSRYPHA